MNDIQRKRKLHSAKSRPTQKVERVSYKGMAWHSAKEVTGGHRVAIDRLGMERSWKKEKDKRARRTLHLQSFPDSKRKSLVLRSQTKQRGQVWIWHLNQWRDFELFPQNTKNNDFSSMHCPVQQTQTLLRDNSGCHLCATFIGRHFSGGEKATFPRTDVFPALWTTVLHDVLH